MPILIKCHGIKNAMNYGKMPKKFAYSKDENAKIPLGLDMDLKSANEL
jgi:hypothetical protein